MQIFILVFWYVDGSTVWNKMLKIHDNILPIKCVSAAHVEHKCTGKLEVFIMAGGDNWRCSHLSMCHYSDVLMAMMASQITSFMIVYSTVYLGADQRKHQSSVSLVFVRGIHQGPVNSLHKGPVTRKMFLFDDVIMRVVHTYYYQPESVSFLTLNNLCHH